MLWSKVISRILQKKTVFRSVGSFAESSSLKKGISVDRPYRAELVAENYSRLTALTPQNLTATNDKLTIDQDKAINMEIDHSDVTQNLHDTLALYSDDAALKLGQAQDAHFLYQVVNANDTIDDGDLGGTAGNPIVVSTANIDQVFGKSNRKLDVNNVDRMGRFAAVSPQFMDVLWERVSGKESMLGDKTAEFASMGKYAGFDLYMSNNLTASAVWTPADNPSEGATITINGVTFTFNATVSGAGSVDIGGTTAGTLDNLVAFINAGGVGDDSTYVSLSAADQKIVQNWVAVDGTTYIEVFAKGASYMTVATSEAGDPWSKETQHLMFGKKGAVDMVVQKEIFTETSSLVAANKSGIGVLLRTFFGAKCFNTGTKEILDVEIDSSNF